METSAEINKVCKDCKLNLPIYNFYKNHRGFYFSYCKKCSGKRAKKHKQTKEYKIKEKIYKQSTEYRKRSNFLKRTQENHRITTMLNNAKRRANKKGLPFTIAKKNITIPERCPLLNIPLEWGSRGDYENTPSLDQIIVNKGYTPDNIRVISKKANSMKNSATKDEMKTFISNIVDYMNIDIKDIVRTIEKEKSIELEDKEPLR